MIDTMDCAEARISLGVYVLGAFDPEERAAVDAHLVTCDGCRAELADLESLPMLLAVLSTEDAAVLADGLPPVTSLGSADSRTAPVAANRPVDLSAARVRRRNRRTAWLSAAAAAAVALAAVGGAQLGIHLGRLMQARMRAGPGGLAERAGKQRGRHARNRPLPSDGLGNPGCGSGDWHSSGYPCAIEAFERNGTTIDGGSWITDSNEGKVWYTGSAAISKDTVAKFVITVAGHPATVITIPI